MWECAWDKLVSTNPAVKEFVKAHPYIERLSPRDAFYGGRTENFKLYHKAAEEEAIAYVDVTSLYPTVNKYGK